MPRSTDKPACFNKFYSLLWKITRPALRRHKRLKTGFTERLVPEEWPYNQSLQSEQILVHNKDHFTLWLQAASGGEAYLSWSILRQLAASQKYIKILCTSCTEQGLEILRKAQAELATDSFSITINYLPLDEPKIMRQAVKQAFGTNQNRNKVLALLETEIWPGLLGACHEAGVKVMLLNGRMTPKSAKAYRLIRSSLRKIAPELIMATSPNDLERFKQVFATSSNTAVPAFSLMNNIKFDRMLEEGQTALKSNLNAAKPAICCPPGLPLLVLGSVRKEEEEIILKLCNNLFESSPNICIALAPRHMHRIPFWNVQLYSARIKSKKRSEGGQPEAGILLLCDVFGELDDLYGAATAAFVGGSLKPLGGQNFLEPLKYGIIPCIGPHWSNFYWVGQELFAEGLVHQVKNLEELSTALLDKLHHPAEASEIKAKFSNYLKKHCGGTVQAGKAILEALQTTAASDTQ